MPSRLVVPSLPQTPSNPRKRTTSFSEHLPRKTSRTMPLRRTESFLCLSDYNDETHFDGGSFLHMAPSPTPPPPPRATLPSRTRMTRTSQPNGAKPGCKRAEFTIAPTPSFCDAAFPKCAAPVPPKQSLPAAPHARTTSPLSPARKLLPPRACFPRSRPEPDLYRVALKGRMRSTPEGEKILRMGPRLAIAILSATKELERIVSAHEDDDVTMGDETEPTMRSVHWGLGRELVAVPCGA